MDTLHHEDVVLSNHYITAIAVLTIIAVSTVWLRIYCRLFVSHNIGWDDWAMLVASVCRTLSLVHLLAKN